MSDLQIPAKGLFIAGTDTEVGKTYVTAMLARKLYEGGHRVGVYKPVASGTLEDGPTDYERIWKAAGQPGSIEQVCPQHFQAPLAPHLAARAESSEVDEALLFSGLEAWHDECELVLVEGVGGLMSPVTDELYCADLADAFGYGLIIVVPNRLGCINQALQTLITAAAFRDGLEIHGIVLNDVEAGGEDASRKSNVDELLARCHPPVLAHLSHGQAHLPPVDWMELAE